MVIYGFPIDEWILLSYHEIFMKLLIWLLIKKNVIGHTPAKRIFQYVVCYIYGNQGSRVNIPPEILFVPRAITWYNSKILGCQH
uniref:Uncharacterized protein n=1 Tax=Nelumbo nucifera TaxID=4432 RepID=A0A822Y110_NELNU|nr:TPA_asm: hypothetical protein HUJ06_026377 [Nelumbo nucifera]DAD24926.1 TPA_asm: hypothetical protein HUJ06_026390 [Nelumbo nucifera]